LDGSFIEDWGSSGEKEDQFDGPGDVEINSKDNLVFAIDIGNNRIQKFDKNGTFLNMWGSQGTDQGQFD
jgi:tripartite motif-containing protein 71